MTLHDADVSRLIDEIARLNDELLNRDAVIDTLSEQIKVTREVENDRRG